MNGFHLQKKRGQQFEGGGSPTLSTWSSRTKGNCFPLPEGSLGGISGKNFSL